MVTMCTSEQKINRFNNNVEHKYWVCQVVFNGYLIVSTGVIKTVISSTIQVILDK